MIFYHCRIVIYEFPHKKVIDLYQIRTEKPTHSLRHHKATEAQLPYFTDSYWQIVKNPSLMGMALPDTYLAKRLSTGQQQIMVVKYPEVSGHMPSPMDADK